MNKIYAVLIDSENVSTKYLDTIFKELNDSGCSTPIRKSYGDFGRSEAKDWNKQCHNHSITLVHAPASSTGKNSTDSSMIIGAMDLLYRETYLDGFVIITNDSDFTSLCKRLRESGKEVIGMAEQINATEMFKKSCTIFKYLDIDKNISKSGEAIKNITSTEIGKAIIDLLSRNEKMRLSAFKELLIKSYPDFDERTYGKKKFSDLIKDIDGIILEPEDDGLTHWVSYNVNNKEKSIKKVIDTITQLLKENENKLNVGDLNARLQKQGIKYRDYGYNTPTKFLNSLEVFSVKGEYIELVK